MSKKLNIEIPEGLSMDEVVMFVRKELTDKGIDYTSLVPISIGELKTDDPGIISQECTFHVFTDESDSLSSKEEFDVAWTLIQKRLTKAQEKNNADTNNG